MNVPLVSVGMPIYNKPLHLEQAIESLLAQSFTDFEMLISDNASPDPQVREICEHYAQLDKRVRYIRQPANISVVENFAYVYEHTNAPYFMWAADDDLWEPQFVERGVVALSSDPSKSAWLGHFDTIDPDGHVIATYPSVTHIASRGNKRLEVLRFLMDARKHTKKVIVIYSLFRREALREPLALMRQNHYMRGFDHVLVYAFICRYDLATDPKTLFHNRELNKKTWPRSSQPWNVFDNRHFAGYSRAAAGTPYSLMTRLLLPPRFLIYQINKLTSSNRLSRALRSLSHASRQ